MPIYMLDRIYHTYGISNRNHNNVILITTRFPMNIFHEANNHLCGKPVVEFSQNEIDKICVDISHTCAMCEDKMVVCDSQRL